MSEVEKEIFQLYQKYKALAKVKKTREEVRQDIQNYIGELHALIGKYGDAPMNFYTLYGGYTLSGEIKIAQQKLDLGQ